MSNQVNTNLMERAGEVKTCSINSCLRKLHGRNLCLKHYKRLWKGNNPHQPTYRDRRPAIVEGDTARIPLGVEAKQGYTTVDKEFAYLDKFNWALSKQGYASKNPGESLSLLQYHVVGKPTEGMVTDHINRDRLDNRTSNLRIVTQQQNVHNSRMKSTNTSGYTGVAWSAARQQWVATIRIKGKARVGYRKSLQEAINLRRQFEGEHYV